MAHFLTVLTDHMYILTHGIIHIRPNTGAMNALEGVLPVHVKLNKTFSMNILQNGMKIVYQWGPSMIIDPVQISPRPYQALEMRSFSLISSIIDFQRQLHLSLSNQKCYVGLVVWISTFRLELYKKSNKNLINLIKLN